MIRTGLALAIALSAGGAVAYRAGPPPAHTGAFGEPDCGECHFDAVRDDPDGSARILVPDAYEPGQSYTVTVEVRRTGLAVAGFQLSARYLHAPAAGEQAGTLESMDGRTAVEVGEKGVMYASHTEAGAGPVGCSNHADVARWTVRWTAPTDRADVAFDLAAQVANDDDSAFGERLYTARHVVQTALSPIE